MLEPALLALLCLAARGAGQEPRVVERSFSSELELSTETFEIEATEGGRSAQQQGPRYEREEATEIEIADTFFDDEAPPAKFSRFYRTVLSSSRLAGEKSPLEKEKTVSAGLEGQRVLFVRDEKGGYERSCDDDDVRQVQLNRLRAELTLACFLPTEEGAADGSGASYTVSFADFARILAPLETRPRRPHPKAGASVGGLNLAPAALTEPMAVLWAASEGELELTPRARRESDELPRNAEITFRFEGSFDGSENVLAGPGEAEDAVEFVYQGTGELAWDPESGRIELRCQGDVTLNEHFRVHLAAGGKKGEARGNLVLTGRLELEASEEPGE